MTTCMATRYLRHATVKGRWNLTRSRHYLAYPSPGVATESGNTCSESDGRRGGQRPGVLGLDFRDFVAN